MAGPASKNSNPHIHALYVKLLYHSLMARRGTLLSKPARSMMTNRGQSFCALITRTIKISPKRQSTTVWCTNCSSAPPGFMSIRKNLSASLRLTSLDLQKKTSLKRHWKLLRCKRQNPFKVQLLKLSRSKIQIIPLEIQTKLLIY